MPARSTLTEAQFQKQILEAAKYHGWRTAHFRSVAIRRPDNSFYHATPVSGDGIGFPDTVLVKHLLCVVEAKVGRNQMTPEQVAWFAALRRAGIPCFLWRPSMWRDIVRILSGEVAIEVSQ